MKAVHPSDEQTLHFANVPRGAGQAKFPFDFARSHHATILPAESPIRSRPEVSVCTVLSSRRRLHMLITRRTLLQAATAAGSRLLFCGCGLLASASRGFGQTPAGGRRRVLVRGQRVRTVDMHCHTYVRDIVALIRHRKEANVTDDLAADDARMDARALDARLAEMDRQGIDIQAISPQSSQAVYWAEPELAAPVVKLHNEKLASVCALHPDRFVALGTVSLQHSDLAAEQMEYAVKKLGMRGFMIAASIQGQEISNPKFDPFWRKAGELGIVIFIHPSGFADGAKRFAGNGNLGNTVGNPLETTVALSHMIFDGFLDRFPDVRILAAHGGGYLPSYIGRSDKCHSWNDACRQMKRKPSEYIRGPQLHFDSVVYSPENMRHLLTAAGADRIVMGTDFSYDMASRSPVDDVLATPDLTAEQQVAILGGNAARLLMLPSA
jgi:aminocarboxymuconate-semialdehyde decarboxylase